METGDDLLRWVDYKMLTSSLGNQSCTAMAECLSLQVESGIGRESQDFGTGSSKNRLLQPDWRPGTPLVASLEITVLLWFIWALQTNCCVFLFRNEPFKNSLQVKCDFKIIAVYYCSLLTRGLVYSAWLTDRLLGGSGLQRWCPASSRFSRSACRLKLWMNIIGVWFSHSSHSQKCRTLDLSWSLNLCIE